MAYKDTDWYIESYQVDELFEIAKSIQKHSTDTLTGELDQIDALKLAATLMQNQAIAEVVICLEKLNGDT